MDKDNKLLRPDIRSQLSGLFLQENNSKRDPIPQYGPPIRFFSTQSSQTEFAVKLKRKPSLAEIHTLSYYNLSGDERAKHLKRLMSGDAVYTDYEYDPCIELIKDVRKSKQNEISYITVKRSIGCQTLFVADDLIPSSNSHKTQTGTQTTSPIKPTVNKGEHELRAEFRSKNNNNNKQKAMLTGPHIEFQSCPEEWKSTKNLKLSDITLYSVFDKFLEKNKNFNKPQYLNSNEMRKLSKSTCELTSVVKNSTDVSSKAMGKNLKPEKFSIQINIPSRIKNMDDASKLSERDEALLRVQEEINVKPTGKYKRNQSEGPNSGRSLSGVGTSTNSDYQRQHTSCVETYNDEELFQSVPQNFDNSNYFKPATILIDRHRASSVSKSEIVSPRFQTSSTHSLSKPSRQTKFFNFNKDTLTNSIDVEDGTLIDVDFDSYNNLSSNSSAFVDELKENRSEPKTSQESDEEVIDVDFSVYDEDNSFYKYENRKESQIITSPPSLNRNSTIFTNNNNDNNSYIHLNSCSNEKDSELIKNIREKIASKKNKNMAMDLLGFDPKLKYSWLNSFTPSYDNGQKRPTIPEENQQKYSSSFETISSKPHSSSTSTSTLNNENNYLVPVVRKPQMPVKFSGENVYRNNEGTTTNQEDSTLNSSQISIPSKPYLPKEQENNSISSNTNTLPNQTRYLKNTLRNTNNETRKIHKIISSIAENELMKIENRIVKRNERVPELLDDLALAEGNEKLKLEKELHLLMRKYKFDKKKFRELKKPLENEELSTSDEAAITDPHVFKRDPNRLASNPTKLKEKTRLEKEIKQFMIENNYISQQESSGYSSYEESTHNSKSQSMESLLSNTNETKEAARASKVRRSLSLTKSPTFQSEFVKNTIKAVEKTKSKTLRNGQMRWEASKLDEISREYLEATAILPVEIENEVNRDYYGRRNELASGPSRSNNQPPPPPIRNRNSPMDSNVNHGNDRDGSSYRSVNTSAGSKSRTVPSSAQQYQQQSQNNTNQTSNSNTNRNRSYSPNLGLGTYSTFRPAATNNVSRTENLNDSRGSNYSSNFQREASPSPKRNTNRTAIPTEIEYIEEEDLDLLNLDNYEIFTDEVSNESYLVNLNEPSGQRVIVLPEDWRSGRSQYLSEEEAEQGNLEIYIDSKTKRKYILDEANDKKYYLVSEKSLTKRKKNLGYNRESKLKRLIDDELIDDSNDVIHFSYNSNSNENLATPVDDNSNNINNDFLGFIDEDELKNIDLTEAVFYEDELTNEIYLQNQNDPDKHWIVLPKDWQVSESSPYLTEEDVQILRCEMYIDPITKRKYVIDEKSGKRYYVINDKDIDNASLKNEWNKRINKNTSQLFNKINKNDQRDRSPNNKKINQALDDVMKSAQASSSGIHRLPGEKNIEPSYRVNSTASENNDFSNKNKKKTLNLGDNKNRAGFIDNVDVNMNLENDKQNFNLKEPDFSNEINKSKNSDLKSALKKPKSSDLIQKYDNEPSIIKYDRIRSNSPNSGLKTNFYIKQTGKMGHKISPRTDVNKQTRIDPNKQHQQQQPTNKNNINNKNGAKPGVKTKKLTREQEIRQAKLRQDANRRAFFSQKLPNMGELWLHQLLLNQVNKEKRIRARAELYRSQDNLDNNLDDDGYAERRAKSLSKDPTLRNGKLDRDRLRDIQIYGYDKYNEDSMRKKRRNQQDPRVLGFNKAEQDRIDSIANDESGFGGGKDTRFIRGVLTEEFVESMEYTPKYINNRVRALVPNTKLNLRNQYLLTPRYLKETWEKTLNQSYKLKPKIILINDDERILTKKKNCNVYVQYVYENDSVLGADRAYQLMLPSRGPTSPTSPLRITPEKLSKAITTNPNNPGLALREAPVYVYHEDGGAYFENIAQYLAGRYPQLSPKTVRKILQFSDVKEFEDYLAAKVTREEARRISMLSGEPRIDIESVKRDLFKLLPDKNASESVYYHRDCEQNLLENLRELKRLKKASPEETKEYIINGKLIHSTFIGFTSTGQVEKVHPDELPDGVLDTIKNEL